MGMDDLTRGGGAASRRAHNPESPVRSRASQPTGATTEVDHGEEEQGQRQRQGREGLLAPNVAHEARGQLLGPDLVCTYDTTSAPGLAKSAEFTITRRFVPISIPASDLPPAMLKADEPLAERIPYYYSFPWRL